MFPVLDTKPNQSQCNHGTWYGINDAFPQKSRFTTRMMSALCIDRSLLLTPMKRTQTIFIENMKLITISTTKKVTYTFLSGSAQHQIYFY